MVDDDFERIVECENCENISFSTDCDERFCVSCGCHLPWSVIFQRAWNEVEQEDIRDVFYEKGKICDEDRHLCLIIRDKIIEALLASEEFFYLKVNFCSFCGKELICELPPNFQKKLEKRISKIKKNLPDKSSPDYFEKLHDQLPEVE